MHLLGETETGSQSRHWRDYAEKDRFVEITTTLQLFTKR